MGKTSRGSSVLARSMVCLIDHPYSTSTEVARLINIDASQVSSALTRELGKARNRVNRRASTTEGRGLEWFYIGD